MAARNNIFTTIRTEGALLPADLLQRISEGENIEGLTPASYHRPGEKLNEAINRSWNALQGAWASFRAAQERLPESDLGTSITRERWLLPLFRELDYGRLQTATAVEIDGRSYPISHGWEHVPVHLVSYKLELDRRTPGAAGAASASPHSLLQVFLNRSETNLWGFLSNGYKLRILRDNVSLTRQAYVEFDLEAMMEGEVYSDFVLLWLLCHQSRVEGERPSDCWLEKWMKVAEDQGTRALDQLRDGVEQAIEALGLGFLEYHANAALRDKLTSGELNAQDYYRQLLRMVYRLLFLFVAEDRELLLNPDAPQAARERYVQFYSTQRLRRMAETFKGTRHPDLFESLRLVMRLLSGDGNGAGAGLGLVPLGSFLFSDRAVTDVIGCQIGNSHLLDAIRALSLTYDQRAQVYRTVDYKNLGSDELGSIFESLLELHPQINVPARRFALATAVGNERKITGSYYTPESLVHALLDSALDPVLDDATKKGEDAILALKVCDPACGSGHFLIAAANRMAKALAFVRTGEEEPPPAAIQEAKRDIISHCIYGVDINPMAVELCKVNLWMEALEPGKPLNFLDHRIQVGNSLLGTTPRLMAGGIPDDAFSPIEGDDPKYAATMKKANKQERKDRETGQRSMFELIAPPADYGAISATMQAIDDLPDDTLAGVRAKEQRYMQLDRDPEYRKARFLADAWCAAFVWEKNGNAIPPLTESIYRQLEKHATEGPYADYRVFVYHYQERYQFFHWHVAFPDVFSVPEDMQHAQNEQTGWNGGFDCVLGNPPWERIKIQEKEWFAERAPEIASAPNAAARKRMISALEQSDPYLYAAFLNDLRKAEGESHYIRVSGRYPLSGVGDVNTYSVFTETARTTVASYGYAGLIIPTGIATDDSLKGFFDDLIQTNSLERLIGFENEEFIFTGIANVVRFCIIGMSGIDIVSDTPTFAFYLRQIKQIEEQERFYQLTARDIALVNPNTLTSPIFRNHVDAELTQSIYNRIAVLENESHQQNLWGIYFLRMFDMASDSGLFAEECSPTSVSLYEGKFFWHFDHRFGGYDLVGKAKGKGGRGLPNQLEENYLNPYYSIEPRYWVDEKEFLARVPDNWDYEWFTGFRDVTSAKLERTAVFSLIPFVAVGHKAPLIFPHNAPSVQHIACFLANMNSLILDYIVRQKIGGTSMSYFILKQLPVLPPDFYSEQDVEFIAGRVLELVYTAWDVQAFAQDMGYSGEPFPWDEERRSILRAELDAYYAKLYGLTRDELRYVLDPADIYGENFPGETFRVLKEKEMDFYGEFRTQRLVLEAWDELFGD